MVNKITIGKILKNIYLKKINSYYLLWIYQRLVRFYAFYQIKPHAPPLATNLRQFLKVSILRSYFPGGVFNA